MVKIKNSLNKLALLSMLSSSAPVLSSQIPKTQIQKNSVLQELETLAEALTTQGLVPFDYIKGYLQEHPEQTQRLDQLLDQANGQDVPFRDWIDGNLRNYEISSWEIRDNNRLVLNLTDRQRDIYAQEGSEHFDGTLVKTYKINPKIKTQIDDITRNCERYLIETGQIPSAQISIEQLQEAFPDYSSQFETLLNSNKEGLALILAEIMKNREILTATHDNIGYILEILNRKYSPEVELYYETKDGFRTIEEVVKVTDETLFKAVGTDKDTYDLDALNYRVTVTDLEGKIVKQTPWTPAMVNGNEFTLRGINKAGVYNLQVEVQDADNQIAQDQESVTLLYEPSAQPTPVKTEEPKKKKDSLTFLGALAGLGIIALLVSKKGKAKPEEGLHGGQETHDPYSTGDSNGLTGYRGINLQSYSLSPSIEDKIHGNYGWSKELPFAFPINEDLTVYGSANNKGIRSLNVGFRY